MPKPKGPNRFSSALDLLIGARYSSVRALLEAIHEQPTYKKIEMIRCWRQGRTYPRFERSFRILRKIEKHFELEEGRLASLVGGMGSAIFAEIKNAHAQNLQVIRWHLPKDFDTRSAKNKKEILSWISANVLACATEYGRYQSAATRHRFGIVFPTLSHLLGDRRWMGDLAKKRMQSSTVPAPARLVAELENFVSFKTALLPPKGYQRRGRWQRTTAASQVSRYGLALGLFSAAKDGEVKGLGVPVSHLTLGLIVFPELWEWYLNWYEKRRGFFANSELNMLYEIKSNTRDPTGWVRQHPELARRLKPIPGYITARDVRWAQAHWAQACDRTFEYALQRVDELVPVARMHRDSFGPIMPVMTAKRPLNLYKKIGDEILRDLPDENEKPMLAAKIARRYLVFRFALHLGIRQRNLRELLLSPKNAARRDARELERVRRGELRWNEKERTWEVFIPAVSIKNGTSSFFQWRPFQMTLPDRENLYWWIDRYIEKHRNVLLNGRTDTGAFFIRSPRKETLTPDFDEDSFYAHWKAIIQQYGIYNPYTKRGAIEGLLPHGPHSVRDVLATHLLKTTGSYELASFALQDTVESVMRHYAHFLPQEKVARAADELNKVWKR